MGDIKRCRVSLLGMCEPHHISEGKVFHTILICKYVLSKVYDVIVRMVKSGASIAVILSMGLAYRGYLICMNLLFFSDKSE